MARPRDQHVVLPFGHTVEHRAPSLTQLPLDAVAHDGASELLRDGNPQPRIVAITVAVEPVENEETRRHGAAVPVDGVEVARAGEAVAALHGCGRRPLRGETLPAARAPPLQDGAAGLRRHPLPEAMATLPSTHVGLIGPFHDSS